MSLRVFAALVLSGCATRAQAPPTKVTDLTVFDIPREPPPAAIATSPTPAPDLARKPKAQVVERATDVELSASSTYGGWPLENAIDGDPQTSWYSDTNDSVAKGQRPFFQVTFQSASTVHRVTVLGNRDPDYFDGFGILRGQLDVFDADGRLLESQKADGAGDRRDYAFTLTASRPVKTLRFTSLRDEGSRNQWGDIAIAEIRAE
jgi:hypothetical protein